MATTLQKSLSDQLSLTIRQRQGEDPRIKKIQTQAVSKLSAQEERAKNNGRLNYPRTPLLDVYQDDINGALQILNQGMYSEAGRISQLALSTDSWISGVFGTFTASITSLPRKFVGDLEIARDLSQGYAGITSDPRSLFDVIVRPSVFSRLLVDMRMFGTAIAELVWLPDLDYPIVAPLEIQFLELDRYSNTWLYKTDTGQRLEVVPGDGHWILITSGGPCEPWHGGIWAAVARDYGRKAEALLNMDAYQRKHASPIRVAQTAQGATGADFDGLLEQMIEWSGTNTQVCLPVGYQLSLVETNGVGYESYAKTVSICNESLTVAIAGQTTTTTGGLGFANGDVGLTIRGDLTKRYANDIACGLSDQLLPYVVASRYGSIDRQVALILETDPPKDKSATAKAVSESAAAIKAVVEATEQAKAAGLNAYQPDISELQRQFGIPEAEIQTLVEAVETVEAQPEPDSVATVVAPAGEEAASVQDTAMNGAQISSLLEIIAQVVANQLPRETAVQIIVLGFNKTAEQADKLLGPVGVSFVPPPPPVEPAQAFG